MICASGIVSYLSICENVMIRRPSSNRLSDMRWFCMSQTDATWRMLRKCFALLISKRSRLTASSIDVLNCSGFRFSAYISRCVSRSASSGVES